MEAFMTLKKKLSLALIILASIWSLLFEIMCNASDYTIRAILGQRKNKKFYINYYASRILNVAQLNCVTMKHKVLVIVFAYAKFHSYLIESKPIVYINHFAIK